MTRRVILLFLALGIAVAVALAVVTPHRAAAPAPPAVTTTTVRPSTTTTDPYTNLRASLDDYCSAIGRGHAFIIVRNGAPQGDCTG